MEVELTESSEIDSKTDNSAVTEEADVDEAKDTMGIEIDYINTCEMRNKVNTIKWRPIYEVIEEAYSKESENFSDDFMQKCKDNANQAQFTPLEIKNNIKRMVT